MQHSILNDVKKYVGIDRFYDVFDSDMYMNINAAFAAVQQLGAGPNKPFTLSSQETTWSDFSTDEVVISFVRQIIYLRVKRVFDPPTTSFVIQMQSEQLSELEWRLRDYCSGIEFFEEESEPELPPPPDEPSPENPPEELKPKTLVDQMPSENDLDVKTGSFDSNLGKNILSDITKGISSTTAPEASMVSTIVDALKDEFKVKSPSKVFLDIGEFTTEGGENVEQPDNTISESEECKSS